MNEMISPFFSFIIPVYNIESYLSECIDSILNQNFQNYEIILVNDGSTDNSLEICNQYRQEDSRIKVINKTNEGLAETRNKGVEKSTGEYIIFLDGDDHIEKTGFGLSELFNVLVGNYIDILLFHLIPFTLNKKAEYEYYEISKLKKIQETTDLANIFKSRVYLASACNKIIKREIIINNNLKFPKGMLSEDITWCGDLLKYSSNIKFYPIEFYFYRKNREGSITFKTSRKNLLDIAEQVKNHFIFLTDNNYRNKVYVDEFYTFYYLSCIKQMCDHEDFSSSEISSILKPISYYLNFSLEHRVLFFRLLVNFLGFNNSIKLLKFYFRK